MAETAAVPQRFVATTYNLWNTQRWPDREPALRGFVRRSVPDILCLQELRAETRAVLDEELPGHARVEEPDVPGWTVEGNIYWSTSMFAEVEHGAEDIGMLEQHRRLFWVRLRTLDDRHGLLVSTAHYTWQGNPQEVGGAPSLRHGQARRTVEELARLAGDDEPLLFMGDLNDAAYPIRLLRESGLTDSFTAAAAPLQPTIPARPTASGNPQVLDWQFHRGPIRAMTSHVGEFFVNDVAPSDHKPVVAAYAFTS